MLLYLIKEEVSVMKVWTKVCLKDQDKNVELICKSLTNYLYGCGPIDDLCKKYNIDIKDRKILDQYTANRVAGILMLYLAGDTKRINDIVNHYNVERTFVEKILPEIEGYINK